MAKVWALWYGGASYSPGMVDDDVEEFASLAAAVREFDHRENGRDPYYPCVEDSVMTVWFRDPRGEYDPYPDRVILIGRRGSVRVELV